MPGRRHFRTEAALIGFTRKSPERINFFQATDTITDVQVNGLTVEVEVNVCSRHAPTTVCRQVISPSTDLLRYDRHTAGRGQCQTLSPYGHRRTNLIGLRSPPPVSPLCLLDARAVDAPGR